MQMVELFLVADVCVLVAYDGEKTTPDFPLMSRIELKYCLISASYLAGLFEIVFFAASLDISHTFPQLLEKFVS